MNSLSLLSSYITLMVQLTCVNSLVVYAQPSIGLASCLGCRVL